MYVCVAENAELLVFFTFFCHFPIGNFVSEGRFWTTTLPHPSPNCHQSQKLDFVRIFAQKNARLLPVLLQKWACLKDSAHCPFRLFFEPFHQTAIDSFLKKNPTSVVLPLYIHTLSKTNTLFFPPSWHSWYLTRKLVSFYVRRQHQSIAVWWKGSKKSLKGQCAESFRQAHFCKSTGERRALFWAKIRTKF